MTLRISPDQINRRLGGSPSQGQGGYEPPNDDGEGEGSSVTMYVSMLAVFAGIGLGTYFYLGNAPTGPEQVEEQSVAQAETDADVPFKTGLDSKCMKGWQKGLPNYDQMHCLMTSDPKRLCSSAGRAELAERVAYYEADYASYRAVVGRQENTQALKMIGGGGMKLGWQQAKMQLAMSDPKLSQAEKDKIAADFFKSVAETTTTKDPIQRKVSSKVGQKKMVKAARELLRLGYMQVEDFGSRTPGFVKEAARDLGEIYESCPKEG